jgi:hypothetical protein
MSATTRNKRLIYQALDHIVPLGKASFANALNFTYHYILEVGSYILFPATAFWSIWVN